MDNKRSVFVIMPFSATETCTEDQWTEIYEEVFRPAIEDCNYLCERAVPSTGSLIKSIVERLSKSTIVLADITDRNANVLYELGVRHAVSRRTIIVSQKLDHIPSDLKGYWSITYGTSPRPLRKFKTDIKGIIAKIEAEPDKSDSPVSDYLDQQEFQDYKQIEEMAAKAKEFKAYEIVEGKRRNLSLLPRPIYTYTDDEGNFDYGTIFAFALGQNPEVLVTFEKYSDYISCELARIGGAEEMHVLWNGQHIWWSDLVGGRDPEFFRSYTNFKYTDLKDGKLFAPEPQIIRIDDKPLLIDTCEARIKIEPDFLDWEAFSMLFWVRITQDFIDTQTNRYLFSYTTDTTDAQDKEHYPNGFYFGIRDSNWEFAIKGPDPRNKTPIKFSPSEVSEGWNLFSITWNGSSRKIKLDITHTDPNIRFESKEKSVVIDSWPKNIEDHPFVLGDWTQHDPNDISGISSLKFYRFCLFRKLLSDSEVRFIFGTERASIQKL